MDDLQLGWVVGLIEGEGWIGIKPPARPEIRVVSTDRDVIERLHEWTGVGVTAGPRPPRPGSTKETYHWYVTKRDDAGRLLAMLLPHLLSRRAERAREGIEAWQSTFTRGTAPTCARGHELVEPNLVIREGRRRCRACINLRARGYRAAKA